MLKIGLLSIALAGPIIKPASCIDVYYIKLGSNLEPECIPDHLRAPSIGESEEEEDDTPPKEEVLHASQSSSDASSGSSSSD